MGSARALMVGGCLAFVLFFAFVVVDQAAAADCATAWDVPTCQNTLDAATAASNVNDALQGLVLDGFPLTPDDRDYLELSARGSWFVGGAIVGVMVAFMFDRAFRLWRDM